MSKIEVGDIVRLRNRKTHAKVVRDLYLPHAQNKWDGWVVVSPPLREYTRWHVDELELVRKGVYK